MAKDKMVKVTPGMISFDAEGVDGVKLIELSIDQLRKEFGDRLIAFTAGTMNQVNNLKEQIDRLQSQLQFQLDRLQAIKENEFQVSRRGDIIFNDYRLNEGL